jgi:hypothetical protein
MNSAATTQDKITAALVGTRIPAKKIHVYGSQIVITAWSLEAANKWASVVAKFATVRRVLESSEVNEADKNVNQTGWVPAKDGRMRRTSHKVWLVYGVIA